MNLMGKLSSHGPDSSRNSRNSHNAAGSHTAAASANVIRTAARTVVACAATVAALTALAVPSSAVAAERANEPYQLGADGTTKPVYSYKDAIREYVYIEIPDDGDGDGKNDLIRADIIRPSELNNGQHNVPIIMDPSPYFGYADLGRGNEGEIKLYENEQDKANSPETQFPLYYDNYFVPRGYAYVLPDLAGTNLSEGCGDIGGKYDLDSAKAVVDWANGRAKAYKSKTAPRDAANEVKADWASGKVASFGKSYDGSVTDGLAATGVEGLTTIVPISGISNQYNWYRAGTGAMYANWWEPGPFAEYLATAEPGASDHSGKAVCKAHVEQMIKDEDATTRNYNDFWKERDYASHVKDFKASVFLVHGVNDLNVQMNNVDKYWAALQANHVPSKIWLSQDGHDDPFDFRRTDWVNEIHRWFDYWLFDIDNGVMNEPQASVENSDGTWSDYASWPVPGARDVTMSFAKGDVDGLGTLGEGTPGVVHARRSLFQGRQGR
ncbi:CocE/NonD family hydrolase [Bifidobacterium aesculapii]|uniref:CocE/NonD family hydrolase n=1 Tax=Bifidobacterium aesculapii TaxID=1329411 RepID=UPI0006E3FB0A|nr:CocE/NonD family hydrolase [Bifidobacterium aesculapii]